MASVSDQGGTDSDQGGADDKEGASGGTGSVNGGPQIRLDTTEEEKLEMYQPYLSCLKENGVPINKAGRAGGAEDPNARPWKPSVGDSSQLWYPSVDVSKYPAAMKACGGKMPRQPVELDPKRNPEYMEQFRAQVECLNREGLKVDGRPDGSGWKYRGESNLSYAEQSRIEQECLMEAFGGRD